MSIEAASDTETAAATERPPLTERVDRRRIVLGLVGSLVFLAVWQAAAMAVGRTYLLPSPLAVAVAFGGELAKTETLALPLVGDVTGSKLLVKLLQSLMHYLPGLLIGTVLGIALGVAMGWSQTVEDLFTPVTRVLRPIPPLAWIAFAIVWIGIGHGGATFIVSIGAFWINFYNAYSGVEGVPQDLTEVAASLGVHDDWTMIRKVVIPSATPELMTGIRTSIGQCWMIVVAAELFGAPGVGYQIINASQNLVSQVSVVYMLVISLVFLASDTLFRRVERRVLAWRN
jgi:NitT/TauT family transport system permease protein